MPVIKNTKNMMKVLIACEFSGIVRDAFRARGYDAWSCDLLPSETTGPHFRTDIRNVLKEDIDWDLLIAHPDCTYLCNSGARWLYHKGTKFRSKNRWSNMRKAAAFFKEMLDADIPRIAVENPIMHGHAKKIVGDYSQTIQPWQFSHGEVKRTCLWLKGLPNLESTDIVDGRTPRVHHASPGPERWKERSRTYTGIAEAMAEQWGKLL